MIDNPKYTKDPNLYAFESFKFVGIEVWQVSSGSIFGNILVTDDIDLAFNEAQAVLSRVPGERAAIEADLAGAKVENIFPATLNFRRRKIFDSFAYGSRVSRSITEI